MLWERFNDQLALVVILGVPILWVLSGMGLVQLTGQVEGATILGWGLVIQFYFRKKPNEEVK